MPDRKALEAYGRKVAALRRQQSGASTVLAQLAEVMKGLHAHQQALGDLPVEALAARLEALHGAIEAQAGQAATGGQVQQVTGAINQSLAQVEQSIRGVMDELASAQQAFQGSLNGVHLAMRDLSPEPVDFGPISSEIRTAMASIESRLSDRIDSASMDLDFPPFSVSVTARDENQDIESVRIDPLSH